MPGFDASEEKPSEEENREAEKKAYTEQRNKYIDEALLEVIKKKKPLFSTGGIDLGTLAHLVSSELYLKSKIIGARVPLPGGYNGVWEDGAAFYKEFSDDIITEQLCAILGISKPEYPSSEEISWKTLKERL